jgi:TFIIF-interacting CTD phosphatase-like protein
MIIKDITRFKNRDMKKSILIDSKNVNFILSPENGLPMTEYNAELEMPGEDDPNMLAIIEEIKEIMKKDDVRTYLKETYGLRTIMKNSKLI